MMSRRSCSARDSSSSLAPSRRVIAVSASAWRSSSAVRSATARSISARVVSSIACRVATSCISRTPCTQAGMKKRSSNAIQPTYSTQRQGLADAIAVDRLRPVDPPQEVVGDGDRRARHHDPPVAVERQERERPEDVEVRLGLAPGQVDQAAPTSASARPRSRAGSPPGPAAPAPAGSAGRRSRRRARSAIRNGGCPGCPGPIHVRGEMYSAVSIAATHSKPSSPANRRSVRRRTRCRCRWNSSRARRSTASRPTSPSSRPGFVLASPRSAPASRTRENKRSVSTAVATLGHPRGYARGLLAVWTSWAGTPPRWKSRRLKGGTGTPRSFVAFRTGRRDRRQSDSSGAMDLVLSGAMPSSRSMPRPNRLATSLGSVGAAAPVRLNHGLGFGRHRVRVRLG